MALNYIWSKSMNCKTREEIRFTSNFHTLLRIVPFYQRQLNFNFIGLIYQDSLIISHFLVYIHFFAVPYANWSLNDAVHRKSEME